MAIVLTSFLILFVCLLVMLRIGLITIPWHKEANEPNKENKLSGYVEENWIYKRRFI